MKRNRDDLNLMEAFQLARQTIQSLMLVNGGAAVAILAFFGTLLSAAHPPTIHRGLVFAALLVFALGLVLGTITSLIGYRVQIRWGAEQQDDSFDLAAFDRRTISLNNWAVVVGLCSLLAFVVGVTLAALALVSW